MVVGEKQDFKNDSLCWSYILVKYKTYMWMQTVQNQYLSFSFKHFIVSMMSMRNATFVRKKGRVIVVINRFRQTQE